MSAFQVHSRHIDFIDLANETITALVAEIARIAGNPGVDVSPSFGDTMARVCSWASVYGQLRREEVAL